MSARHVQVMTTTETRADAQALADHILRRRLAACVQIVGPVESRFWWRDEINTAIEWLCLIKSTRETFHQLSRAIKSKHSYETPEITATPIANGSEEYLQWIDGEVAPPHRDG